MDFAKNGVKAPRLDKEVRPPNYPHYMEKKDKGSYQSTTILGQLYDAVLQENFQYHTDPQQEISRTASFPYRSFEYAGYQAYERDASSTKQDYDRELKRVMRQYGVQHEAEFVSGYILQFNSKQYAKQTKLFELRKEIAQAYRVIRDK